MKKTSTTDKDEVSMKLLFELAALVIMLTIRAILQRFFYVFQESKKEKGVKSR